MSRRSNLPGLDEQGRFANNYNYRGRSSWYRDEDDDNRYSSRSSRYDDEDNDDGYYSPLQPQ